MPPSLAGRFPVAARTTRGRDVYALTPEKYYSLHAYFDRSPFDASLRRMICFRTAECHATQGQVVLLDLSTGRETVLDDVRGFNLHIGVNLQWGPGAGRAYYNAVSLRAPSTAEKPVMALNVVDVDSGRIERLSPTWAVVNPQRLEFVALEEHGQKLVCSGTDGSHHRELATMKQALSLNPKRASYAPLKLTFSHLKWSPDGRRILFLIDDIGADNGAGHIVKDLYVVDRDGSNLRYLNSIKKHPSWTPDGNQILFWGRGPGVNDARIMLLDVREEHPAHRPISKRALPSHPSMSNDGKWVIADVYDFGAGTMRMHLLDVQSGDDEVILEMARPEVFADGTRNATHGHPVWTRDDRAVVFNSQPGRNSQIFFMPI